MDQKLINKFEQLKSAPVTIDLKSEIMAKIESPTSRRSMIPIALGVVTMIISVILLFPKVQQMHLEKPIEVDQSVKLVNRYPRYFSIYPSPYFHLDLEQLEKGGKYNP